MNIQSLSIVVPCGDHCWNNCKFCVSRMHHEDYGKSIISPTSIPQSYMDRVQWCRDEGCNALIFTGTTEPQQNLPFIYKFMHYQWDLRKPFYNISMQTTGSNLNYTDIEELAKAGITTIALSISSFDDVRNWDIIQTPQKLRIMTLESIIHCAKENNLNVRACINLTDEFYTMSFNPESFFSWANQNKVDQLTFRKIYKDGDNEKSKWIAQHEFPEERFIKIQTYIRSHGVLIARLPYGFIQYSVNGISTVIDDNCMSKDNIEEMKYAILRPNGHLYSRWDDTGSLIF